MAASKIDTGRRRYKAEFKLRQAELQKNLEAAEKYKKLLALTGEDFNKAAVSAGVGESDEKPDQVGLSGDIAERIMENSKTLGYKDKEGNVCRVTSHGTLVNAAGQTVGFMDISGRVGFVGKDGRDIYSTKGELVGCLDENNVLRNSDGVVVQLAKPSEDNNNANGAKDLEPVDPVEPVEPVEPVVSVVSVEPVEPSTGTTGSKGPKGKTTKSVRIKQSLKKTEAYS